MSDSQQLRRLLFQQLQSLQSAGVLDLPRPIAGPGVAEQPPAIAQRAAELAAPASPDSSPDPPPETVALTGADPEPALLEPSPPGTEPAQQRLVLLKTLSQEVAQCTLCEELAGSRTQTVFGVGNPQARLVFLGEAPGADEDRVGEPFVGRAGQLLTKIIEACTLRREDVYILNILKCRPPKNRNPSPTESANCRKFLDRQLDAIDPEFICCLGAVAAQNLLGTTVPISRLRGQLHAYGKFKVVATYHPAYLLRNPEAKKDAWTDMKFLMRQMGIEIPTRRS